MSKKRSILRDTFTVVRVTRTKLPNGDITETPDTESTYRCAAINKETVLLDRAEDMPQVEFDYVLEVRDETLTASAIGKGSNVTISKTGLSRYQVTKVIKDSLRRSRILISSTTNSTFE